jgi:hypothetical protein
MDMKPGSELDALIAEKVMGFKKEWQPLWNKHHWLLPNGLVIDTNWSPSTDIATAWLVVEKLRLTVWPTEDGRWFVFRDEFGTGYGDEYWFGGSDFSKRLEEPSYEWVVAETAPLAICLSALKASGYVFPG